MAVAKEWFPREEAFLIRLEKQCNAYQKHFTEEYTTYSTSARRYNIPILVISAINGLTAVGLTSFVEQKYVSVLNAILSAGTGVLGSIQLYLKISEKQTKAMQASLLMKRLALKISKEISIDAGQRQTDGKTFIQECFGEFNAALENGNPIEVDLDNHVTVNIVEPSVKKNMFGFRTSPPTTPSRESFDSGARGKSLWNTLRVDNLKEVFRTPSPASSLAS
jgi:hypothetical protein